MRFNGERFTSARKMRGFSLQVLANKLTAIGHPITKQALNKYEHGTSKPNTFVYYALLKVLNIRPDYFANIREPIVFGEIHWCKLKGRYY